MDLRWNDIKKVKQKNSEKSVPESLVTRGVNEREPGLRAEGPTTKLLSCCMDPVVTLLSASSDVKTSFKDVATSCSNLQKP